MQQVDVPFKLSITVPTTPSLLRSRVLEGKYAILPNLPHPTVQKVGVHAYVSLKEIIADFLAHGTPFEKVCATTSGITHVTAVGQSRKALSIQARADVYFPKKKPLPVL